MKKYIPVFCCFLAIAAILTVPVLVSMKKEENNASPVSDSAQSSPEPEIPEELKSLAGKTIVIDPGHGGPDPGKVGINQALEKDINLSVSLKLKELLESCQTKVIITRTEDRCLGDEASSNQKREDMRKRVEIINGSNADFAVSIHQNSFQQESSKGAQVFYHASSAQGQSLADSIQQSLIENADPENHRAAKANDTYYLLKKSTCPLVIVECGFLSNSAEAEKLCTDDYQNTLARAIVTGIADYFNTPPRVSP